MRKKTLSLMVLLVLSFLLLSCIKEGEKEQRTTVQKEVNENKREKAEKKENKNSNENENKEVSVLPHLLLEIRGNAEVDSDYRSLYNMTEVRLQLKEEGEEFESLQKAIDSYNNEQEKIYQKDLKDLQAFAQSKVKNGDDNSVYTSPDIGLEARIIRADKHIVSVLYKKRIQLDEELPNYHFYSINFDTVSGKKLSFSDIVKDEKQFLVLLDEKAKESDRLGFGIPSELIQESKKDGREIVWTVHAEGISVYFDIHEDGRTQENPEIFTIYFDEGKELFVDKYAKTEEEYVIPLIENAKFEVDIDADGKKDTIYTKVMEDGYYGAYTGISVVVNNKESEAIEGLSGDMYLIKKSGKYYIYVFVQEVDDISILYRLNLSTLELKDEEYWLVNLAIKDYIWNNEDTYYKQETFTDATGFYGESRNEVLSTNMTMIEWTIDEEAYPKPKGNRYKVESNRVLHSLQEIVSQEVDAEGNPIKEFIIPADSYLKFMYSDNESWVDMRIVDKKHIVEDSYGGGIKYFSLKDNNLSDDGTCYRIQVEMDSETWTSKVNDIDVNELLEGIVYTG